MQKMARIVRHALLLWHLWTRMKKITLMEPVNRDWKNLADGWFGQPVARDE
jgi:hypothetical protein